MSRFGLDALAKHCFCFLPQHPILRLPMARPYSNIDLCSPSPPNDVDLDCCGLSDIVAQCALTLVRSRRIYHRSSCTPHLRPAPPSSLHHVLPPSGRLTALWTPNLTQTRPVPARRSSIHSIHVHRTLSPSFHSLRIHLHLNADPLLVGATSPRR
jgi:hypothetical protein